MKPLLKDLQYAARGLAKQPIFSALVVFILAMGIAGNSCIFSVLNVLVLDPLDFEDPDRLIQMDLASPKNNLPQLAMSPPDYLDFKEQNNCLVDLALYSSKTASYNLTGDGDPERLGGRSVSTNFFSVLGIEPQMGRSFAPDDENAEKVVLLSHALFMRRFGGDREAVGSKIILNEIAHEVIGILPPNFSFASADVEIWLPFDFNPATASRFRRQFEAVGRLLPDKKVEVARTEMLDISRRMEEQYPDTNAELESRVSTLYASIFGDDFARRWIVAFIAAFGLLVIACANIANLLLTRAVSREREFALRSALGAGRWQLIRYFLLEGLVLAIPGTLIAVVISYLGLGLVTAFLPSDLPQVAEVGISGKVLVFAALLALLTTLISSILPGIFNTSREKLTLVLSEGSRGSSARRSAQAMSVMVVLEIALALVLLIAAGLVIRSFQQLQKVERGIDPENVLAVRLTAAQEKYPEPAQFVNFLNEVLTQVRAVPGVVSAAAIDELPTPDYFDWALRFLVESEERPEPGKEPVARLRVVGPDYFKSVGIEILQGRDFSSHDDAGKTHVVAVNQELVDTFFPDGVAVGRTIQLILRQPLQAEIVGVVANVRQVGLREPIQPAVYMNFSQRPMYTTSLAIKTASDPEGMVAPVRAAVMRAAPHQPIYRIETLETAVAQDVAQDRALALLLTVLMFMALTLAAAGLYGVMAYSVTQRSREVGIRLAMGASWSDVLKLVVRKGLILSSVGLGVGLVASLVGNRALSPLLYEVSSWNPWIFMLVATALILISLLATLIPAMRAASINPAETLKLE